MTIAEFQAVLDKLGYDTGGCDGVWGSKTAAACEAMCSEHLGITTEDSGDFWDTVKYFTREEFRCKCGKCGGFTAEPAEKLVRILDDVRERLGKPIIISSGVRCPTHNAEVGGVSNSRHLLGHAADFACPQKTQAEVMALLSQYPDIKYMYAIDSQYIHADIGG